MKPTLDIATSNSGVTISDTPAASATSVSPLRKLWQARCTATSPELQAVSIDRLGPRRSSRNDSRLANTLCSVPVSVRRSIASGSAYCSCA
jgi:hypothetical protein